MKFSSKDYHIRPVHRYDQSFLEDFLFRVVYVPPGEKEPSAEIFHSRELHQYVDEWGKTGDYGLFVIENNTNKKIGAAWLRLFEAADCSYGYIADDIPELAMAIDPARRGRGIGTLLLKELIAQTKKRYPAISLSVHRENPAIKLYERFGFISEREEKSSVVMKLKL